MLKNPVVINKEEQGKAQRTAIRDLQEKGFEMEERRISGLFRNYFNNKMTLVIFLIQNERCQLDPKLAEAVRYFLNDIYHHMLEAEAQRRYRLVFVWLKKFLDQLPVVSTKRREKAMRLVRTLYEIVGIPLKLNIGKEKA